MNIERSTWKLVKGTMLAEICSSSATYTACNRRLWVIYNYGVRSWFGDYMSSSVSGICVCSFECCVRSVNMFSFIRGKLDASVAMIYVVQYAVVHGWPKYAVPKFGQRWSSFRI